MGLKNIFPQDKLKILQDLLKNSSRIVVTGHMRPDGDAIGSCLGLCHMLKMQGKDAVVILPDRAPESLQFLPGASEIVVYTQHEEYTKRILGESDLIIMCDFNTATRQGNLAPSVQASPAKRVVIDHHCNPDLQSMVEFSYPEMSSTCELMFRLIAALGYYSEMDEITATCILTGMITDTQNFTVNISDPDTFEIMIKLLEKGAEKERIVYEALKATSYNALRLNSFAISERLEIFPSHRSCIITLSKGDLEKFNYRKGDTEGLVNEPLRIRGIIYSIFLREDEDCIKISMRSRYNFPVGKICSEQFGGGGHIQAAGAEYDGSLEECRKKMISVMKEYDQYLPSKLEKLDIK